MGLVTSDWCPISAQVTSPWRSPKGLPSLSEDLKMPGSMYRPTGWWIANTQIWLKHFLPRHLGSNEIEAHLNRCHDTSLEADAQIGCLLCWGYLSQSSEFQTFLIGIQAIQLRVQPTAMLKGGAWCWHMLESNYDDSSLFWYPIKTKPETWEDSINKLFLLFLGNMLIIFVAVFGATDCDLWLLNPCWWQAWVALLVYPPWKKRGKWEVTGPLCFGSLVADILLLHNPSIYKSGIGWSDLLRSCILNLEMPRTTLTLLWVKHRNSVDNYIDSNSDRRLRDVANSPTTTSINVAQLPVWHYSVWTDYTCRARNTNSIHTY